MSNRFNAVVLCIGILISFSTVYAQGTALSLKIGTLGAGLEVTQSLAGRFNLRAGADFMGIGYSGETSASEPVAYDLDLSMLAFSMLADYYPFNFGMRLSGGFFYNGMKIEGTGRAIENYEFDGNVFTPEEIGEFTMLTEPSLKFSPYLGLGFGNPANSENKVGMTLDIGFLYMGAPDVTLSADQEAMIYPTTSQEADVEKDLEQFKWFPVIAIGLSYTF